MKAFKSAVSALILGALIAAAPALRAEDKGKGKGDQHQRWDKFEMLKKKLDLSDEQVSKWKEAEKGQHEDAKLLRDKLKADKARLAVLVDEKADDAKLTEALTTLQDDAKALKDQREKVREAVKAILTPLQQAKLVVSMGGHGRRGFGGRPGPWMGGHGGPDGGDHGDWGAGPDKE